MLWFVFWIIIVVGLFILCKTIREDDYAIIGIVLFFIGLVPSVGLSCTVSEEKFFSKAELTSLIEYTYSETDKCNQNEYFMIESFTDKSFYVKKSLTDIEKVSIRDVQYGDENTIIQEDYHFKMTPWKFPKKRTVYRLIVKE